MDENALDLRTGLSQSALTAEALKVTGQIISGITSKACSLEDIQKERRQIVKTAFLLVEAVVEETEARQDVQKNPENPA